MIRFIRRGSAAWSLACVMAGGCGSANSAGDEATSDTGNGQDPDGSHGNDDADDDADDDGGTGANQDPCDSCQPDQVCSNGTCTDLPEHCPCPVESYCDLAMDTCVVGGLGDEDCSADRYCDVAERTCRDGCRDDGCGSNEVCDPSTRTCTCEPGFHRCGDVCEPEGIDSCGPGCAVCPDDPHGASTCSGGRCELECAPGYEMCGDACSPCPTGSATAFVCDGNECVAADCAPGMHVCAGECETENMASCGPDCATCSDTQEGACFDDACYGVVDIGLLAASSSCEERCAAQGRGCAEACEIRYTRPNGGRPYVELAGGHYTQEAAFEPWGYLACDDVPPGGAPTSLRCCCTDELIAPPMPGCTEHTDCGASEFCEADAQECFPTVDTDCPDGYTNQGQCGPGGDYFCVHDGLPPGTTFPFETPCPAGTTQRGSFYCSGVSRVCVPND